MGTSRMNQVKIYVGKHFRLFKNEKGWKIILFAAVISFLVSLVLGSGMFIYDMDTFSGCFALISACIWIGIFNSIQTVCKEREIIKREHRTGLHISAYIISHMIYQAVICFVQTIILLVVSAFFLEYPSGSALLGSVYIEFFITYFLVTYSADVLGLAVSSIVKTPGTAMTIMPFVLIIQLIFSGVLFSLQGPIASVANFTISKWGINATCTSANYNELEKTEKIKVKNYMAQAINENKLPVTQEMLDQMVDENFESDPLPQYRYTLGHLAAQWGILLVHTIVYAGVAIAALEFIDKDKR